jgi:hypothetical protein
LAKSDADRGNTDFVDCIAYPFGALEHSGRAALGSGSLAKDAAPTD